MEIMMVTYQLIPYEPNSKTMFNVFMRSKYVGYVWLIYKEGWHCTAHHLIGGYDSQYRHHFPWENERLAATYLVNIYRENT
jgi:hypothetical protein